MAFWNPFKRKQHDEMTQDINAILNTPETEAMKNNPNFSIFRGFQNDIANALAYKSVTSEHDTERLLTTPIYQSVINNITVLPIITDKKERIKQYRSMAMFHECNWCIEEICDDFIHEDIDGEFIKLNLPDDKTNLNTTRLNVIQSEFHRFLDLFDLKNEGFNLIKRFLIEGELAFENIINSKYPDKGIIAVKFLPSEYYETLMDQKTGQRVGLFFNKDELTNDMRTVLSQSYMGSQQIFNSMLTSAATPYNKDNCIPLLWPQVTYIDSGDFSADGLICYSILERVKQPYHQLSLLKDAAVILRVTRAPERLLFNVSTGRMNQNYANNYVRNFANELKSKKVVGRPGIDGKPDVASVYNPVSMLESYVFGKSEANDGTTVESVGSSANYEEIADIEFFLRDLMKAFKVPYSRYKTPENVAEKNESISYEEYSFLRMVIRQQRRFARGLRNAFIIDLKLRGIWDRFELEDQDIDVAFNPPALYDQYQVQKNLEMKMNMYSSVVQNEELSKTLAMKKILKWSDDEIDENFKALIKEKSNTALADYYAEQLQSEGPAVFDPPIAIKGKEIKTPDIESGDEGDEGDETEEVQDDSSGDDTGGESEESSDDSDSNDSGGGGFGLN